MIPTPRQVKVLVCLGGAASVAFGLWHFFVPGIWNWFDYIAADATELVLAVNAINVMFSLALAIIGAIGIFLVLPRQADQYALAVVLSGSVVMWLVRSGLQMARPQGTLVPGLQYGLLAGFLAITVAYAWALLSVWRRAANA